MINVDITILIQFINLCISMVFLHFVIIKPIRHNVALRVQESTALTKEIEALSIAVEQEMEKYRENMEAFQRGIDAEKITMALAAENESIQIIARAEQEKQKNMVEVEALLRSSFDLAKKDLLNKKDHFVSCVVQKII